MATMTRTGPTSGGAIAAPMPRGFTALEPATGVQVDGADRDAFIWFANRKSGKLWDDIAKRLAPQGLIEGDVIYVSPDLTEKLGVLRFHLVAATHYYALTNPATGRPERKAWKEKKSADADAREFCDAVILVYTSKGLMPARIVFKSGLIPAVAPVLRELNDIATDPAEWAKRSGDHAIAARFDPVYLRFVASASFASRTAKTSGFAYLSGSCQCRPTTSVEAKEFPKLGEESVAALCELVAAEHKKRTAEINKLMS